MVMGSEFVNGSLAVVVDSASVVESRPVEGAGLVTGSCVVVDTDSLLVSGEVTVSVLGSGMVVASALVGGSGDVIGSSVMGFPTIEGYKKK